MDITHIQTIVYLEQGPKIKSLPPADHWNAACYF